MYIKKIIYFFLSNKLKWVKSYISFCRLLFVYDQVFSEVKRNQSYSHKNYQIEIKKNNIKSYQEGEKIR